MRETLSHSLPYFDALPSDLQSLLLDNALEKHFPKGTVICHGGGECIGLEIIRSGQVRVFITSPNGGEITLYRLLGGDVCVMSAACMIKNLDFQINMEFEADSDVSIIPTRIYQMLSDASPLAKDFTLELVSSRFSDVMWIFGQFVFSNMAHRLAECLLEHRTLAKSDHLTITHDQLARDLGSAREVVSRLLKQFQLDGLVALSRGAITILDIQRLGGI
ncbi:MAG: Crp/Fnr family transcriptional regulator [Clostridia bacterium]